MDQVYEALGVDAANSYSERVPAHRMLVALETAAPWVCEDRPDMMEKAAHWRKVGADYLRRAIKHWGQDVPAMLCEEEVFAEDYAPRAVMDRLARRRGYRARAEAQAKAQQDGQQNAIVQDWLTERRAHQYDRMPALSLPEYLASCAPPRDGQPIAEIERLNESIRLASSTGKHETNTNPTRKHRKTL